MEIELPVCEQAVGFDKGNDVVKAFAGVHIAEKKGFVATHPRAVTRHHFQRGANQWRKVGFIDYQQIGFGDARPTFAWDFFPAETSIT